jgi:hypothetical protein
LDPDGKSLLKGKGHFCAKGKSATAVENLSRGGECEPDAMVGLVRLAGAGIAITHGMGATRWISPAKPTGQVET